MEMEMEMKTHRTHDDILLYTLTMYSWNGNVKQ